MAGAAGGAPARAAEARRQALQDILIVLALCGVVAIVGFSLWRLDNRSERLFNVVATAQACTCPR